MKNESLAFSAVWTMVLNLLSTRALCIELADFPVPDGAPLLFFARLRGTPQHGPDKHEIAYRAGVYLEASNAPVGAPSEGHLADGIGCFKDVLAHRMKLLH